MRVGLVYSLVGTVANVADVTQVNQLLHGGATDVIGGSGYTGVDKHAEHQMMLVNRGTPQPLQKAWREEFDRTRALQD